MTFKQVITSGVCTTFLKQKLTEWQGGTVIYVHWTKYKYVERRFTENF